MMNKEITTLHIPIDRGVRDQLDTKAKKLGFDSAQAYIRVWAKAEAEGRTLDFGDSWGEPTPTAVARLNQLAKEARKQSAAGELKSYNTVKDLMNDLLNDKTD